MATCTSGKRKVQHLVVDSSALIRNSPIHEIGENIYTVENLVKEIRDKATRQALQVLPYEIKFRTPPSEDIKYVIDFSKKTGDYPGLSVVDIHLLALTFTLAKEYCVDSLKKEPTLCHVVPSHASNFCKSVVGFFSPNEKDSETDKQNIESIEENCNIDSEEKNNCEIANEDVTLCLKPLDEHGQVQKANDENTMGGFPDENMKNYEDEDDEGWITADNIEEAKNQLGVLSLEDSSVTVACITTDFSMQNVLMQMGLPVISTDGMLIKCARTFILRCHACFKTTSIMTKQFCPNCGNKTLKRVAVTVNENGEKTLHINFRRPINIRGTRYSLPAPKGGKHCSNPVICEDQPIPQNRPSKRGLKKVDVFDPDYQAFASPFAIHDIYSRAGSLGIKGKQAGAFNHCNPNARKKNTGNRKKK